LLRAGLISLVLSTGITGGCRTILERLLPGTTIVVPGKEYALTNNEGQAIGKIIFYNEHGEMVQRFEAHGIVDKSSADFVDYKASGRIRRSQWTSRIKEGEKTIELFRAGAYIGKFISKLRDNDRDKKISVQTEVYDKDNNLIKTVDGYPVGYPQDFLIPHESLKEDGIYQAISS